MATLPAIVAGVYLVTSLTTIAVYAVDKRAARSGRWRIHERTLHLLSVTGGWPGALLAQRMLRHKSRKTSFQLFFWGTVIINCSTVFYILQRCG